ncbi:MAG: pectate lyase [Spirochaetes bacterium]|nr:pectate lyase [Spirochaetota bacterium]
MKKWVIFILSVLFIVVLAFWFSCNPFSDSEVNNTFDVLDGSGSSRLTITCTIVVNGSTWDGGGQTITAVGMGDGSQDEGQKAIFSITNGTVRNVTIGPPACDGMHFMGGNSTITNVSVPDVGEDACTVKKPGTYTISNSTLNEAADKVFQINDLCTITYSRNNCRNIVKYVQQNGGMTWKCTVYIDGGTLNNISDCIGHSYSPSSIFYHRNISSNLDRSKWFRGEMQVYEY